MANIKRIKRAYHKKNIEYWSNRQQFIERGKKSSKYLRKYRETRIAIANKEDAYSKYVKAYYAQTRALRKGKVRIGKIEGSKLNTREDFRINMKSGGFKSIDEYINRQFKLISPESAQILRQEIKKATGHMPSMQQALARQLTTAEWNVIDKYYNDLIREGVDWHEAKLNIGEHFFGS